MVTRCNSCGSMEQTEWVVEEESPVKQEIEQCSVCKSYDLFHFDDSNPLYEEDNYGNEM